MNAYGLPDPLYRRLRSIRPLRRLVHRWRGEDRPFHRRIHFDDLPALEHALYVGTHHKAGTVWMQTTFLTYAKVADCSFHTVGRPFRIERNRHRIVFDDHARTRGMDFAAMRGFRMVRDPRDVLVSGLHYHRTAHEPWLHLPREEFGGRTYQQALNAEPDDEAGLLFELEHIGGENIAAMIAFDGGPTIRTIRYEDYIADADMLLWHELFHWMGLRRLDLLLAMQALYQNSVFGLMGKRGHVRSGRARQWEAAFTPRVRARFDELFPDGPARLGYD